MNRISLISRIYVWSVIFEPLVFFVLWHRSLIGISGNVSKLLQLIVILTLLLRFLIKSSRLKIINFTYPYYYNYGIYLIIVIFAGLVGFVSGSYEVSAPQLEGSSWFSMVLTSPSVRPIFEYVIAIYYFIYFVVLPRHMLKTERALLYFFSVFRITFIISLIVGLVDLVALAVGGIELVPRHLDDWVHVSNRFHGLAGEPRQAFIYLFYGLAILHSEAYMRRQSFNKLWFIPVILAAIMTQSFSGLIGIIFFLALYMIYSLPRLINFRAFFLLFAVLIITSVSINVTIKRIPRNLAYVEAMTDLWYLLESKIDLPYLMRTQSKNIYPLYDLTVKARDLDVIPILIGSGLGSASAINNRYIIASSNETGSGSSDLLNPGSQLVRLIFESGLIGTFFFITSFIYPVKKLTKNIALKNSRTFIILTLLLTGCFMSMRSAGPFIFLGVFLAQFIPLQYRYN